MVDFRRKAAVFSLFLGAGLLADAAEAQLVTGNFFFPTPEVGLPNPARIAISDPPGNPTVVSVAVDCPGPQVCLASSRLPSPRILVLDTQTAASRATLVVPGYEGGGTIAVAPDRAFALVGENSTLSVVAAPFDVLSVITQISLPGTLGYWQTQGIVFDFGNRAFVYTDAGISVLDPPYSRIAFTIPVSGNQGGGIAISRDGGTLIVTKLTQDGFVDIFKAPFTASSLPEALFVDPNHPDGVGISPDGSMAIVTAFSTGEVFFVQGPFGPTSVVQQLPFPPNLEGTHFEHVAFNDEGTLAALAGGVADSNWPVVLIGAPFTVAQATVHVVAIDAGRGVGGASFFRGPLFMDGFERGDATAWSQVVSAAP